MPTPIKPVTVMVAPSIRAYGYRRLVAGILIGVVLGLAWSASIAPVVVADPRMERACGYPKLPGQSLMIGIDEQGVTRCWKGPQ